MVRAAASSATASEYRGDVPSTQDLITTAIERFQAEVPALAPLKLVFELDLRARGDVQMFRVELPGPKISKAASTEEARVMVEMLGLFAFHVGERKASRARHSEFVDLLPSPESDLRHW